MIELGCGNEQEAFERFFELLTEFLQRDDRSVPSNSDQAVELLNVQYLRDRTSENHATPKRDRTKRA